MNVCLPFLQINVLGNSYAAIFWSKDSVSAKIIDGAVINFWPSMYFDILLTSTGILIS